MPYIKPELRKPFEDCIDNMVSKMYHTMTAGELNFIISSLIDSYIIIKGLKYQNLNDVVGVLECAKAEFYRKIVVPYEIEKEKDNGPI